MPTGGESSPRAGAAPAAPSAAGTSLGTAGPVGVPGAVPHAPEVHPEPVVPGRAVAEGTGADLRRFVAYRAATSVGLTSGIWVIYLRERGLSLGEIGLAEAVFHLAPITLELPTGSLADVFGRKWSLVAGSLVGSLSAVLMLAVRDLWLALPAMYLAGASMTFASGAGEAFLYDALDEGGAADRFTRVFGRLLSLSFLLFGLTVWLGALLAEVSFALPYALSALVGLAAAGLAAGLREPERERVAHRSMRRTVGEAVAIVRGRPRLLALLLYAAAFWTAVTLVELYAQAVLDGLGLATWLVGLTIGGSFVLVAAGAWAAPRLTSRGPFAGWTVGLAALTVAGALALGSEVLLLAVAVFLVFEFFTGVYEPYLSERVNRDLAAPQRATILSMQGFLFSLTMVWAFPLVGWLAGSAGWLAAFGLVSGLLGAALAGWLWVERRAG